MPGKWQDEGVADGSVHRARRPIISREHVLDEAADALARGGVESISLRAIARRLGVVSSAIYRHYPSRDALLSDLIAESRASLAEWVTQAEASVARTQLTERFAVIVRSARDWAKRNPHRYALIYGAPVPGDSTTAKLIEPGSEIGALMATLLTDAAAAGRRPPPDPARVVVAPSFASLAEALAVPGDVAATVPVGVEVWSQLFGHLSFEVFGHYVGVTDDVDAYTEYLIGVMAARLGLEPPA